MLLTVAVGLTDSRLDWDAFPLFVLNALPAALFFYLGMQVRPEAGPPPAFQSTLLVAGLALALSALIRLAEALGADDAFEAGTVTWVALAFGALALWPGIRKRSAICAFIAALSFGTAVIAGWQWIFEPDSPAPFRWLLLLIALGYVFVALVLRASSQRHSELLVSAGGIAVLGIAALSGLGPLLAFGDAAELPNFWELVLLVAGCGLIAYAAADKVPGPAFAGVAVLAAFTQLTIGDEATLVGWPLLLLLLGIVVLAAGLRPRDPLPPQPEPIPASDLPLAARTQADESVIRVRDES